MTCSGTARRLVLALLVAGLAARPAGAGGDPCEAAWPRTTHKVRIWLPDAVAGDATARAAALTELAPFVFAVIADDGPGVDAPVVVEVDDEQLAVLAAAGDVENVDGNDVVFLPGVEIDVAGRGRLEPPLAIPGWKLAAPPSAPVPYLVVPRAPASPGAWWRGVVAAFAGLGLTLVPGDLGGYRVEMTAAQARTVATWAEIEWVGRLEPLYKIDAALVPDAACAWFGVDHADELAAALGDADTAADPVAVSIRVLDDTPALARALARAGVTIARREVDGDLTVVVADLPRRALRAVANRPEVLAVTRR